MELTLNTEKSCEVKAYKEPFDFLGFTFRYDISLYNRKRKYWNVMPSKKSENKIRDKIRAYFKRCRHYKTEEVVKAVNIMTEGWLNYFHIPKTSYPRKAGENLQSCIDRKFYRHFVKKSQRKGKYYAKGGFRRLVEEYGLKDPLKLIKLAKTANA